MFSEWADARAPRFFASVNCSGGNNTARSGGNFALHRSVATTHSLNGTIGAKASVGRPLKTLGSQPRVAPRIES
jgi:hypothetical protein